MFKKFCYGFIISILQSLYSDVNVFYNININTNQSQSTAKNKIISDTYQPVSDGILQYIDEKKKVLIFLLVFFYFYTNSFFDVKCIYLCLKKIAIFGWQVGKDMHRWISKKYKKNQQNYNDKQEKEKK